MTLIGRRKLEAVPEQYKVDVAAEEAAGRLKQHVQGKLTQDTRTIRDMHNLGPSLHKSNTLHTVTQTKTEYI